MPWLPGDWFRERCEPLTMIPRWYRTRWFWAGLLGLILWIAAWAGSFAGGKGHTWSWTTSKRHYYVSHGAGWIGCGIGESMAVRHPSLSALNGWRHSTWGVGSKNEERRLPTVQFGIAQGNASLRTPYSTLIAAWSIAWLMPLVCRSLPRRNRPPRFPGTPRRWFTSPFLWAGLPGCIMLVALWIDSTTHRSHASWKWTRGYKVEPSYLGFGVESNRGHAAIWSGRAYEGTYFRSIKPGLFHGRKPSTGAFFSPDAKDRKGARNFKTSYLALTTTYLLLWASAASIWQYRQSRLRHMSPQ